MTKRSRPDLDHVRSAMRGRDERADDPEARDEPAPGAGETGEGEGEGEDDDGPAAARP